MKRRHYLQLSALAAACGLGFGGSARAVNARVVILGGGFAGSACALQLRRLNPAIEVILVDPQPSFVSCPLSNEVLVGLRDIRSITLARAGMRHAGVKVIIDRAVGIDAQRRRIQLAGGQILAFDRAVVAPGIRLLWDQLDGYSEAAAESMPHAWQAGPQTLRLAQQLRGMADGGVVAISVPAGLMRCPPAPYERASLIADYLSRHKPRSKVLIFDSNNQFPRQDLFMDAWRSLYNGMIDWIAPTEDGTLTRVDAANMTLYTANGRHRVEVANIIPAQAPGELALDAGLASGRGWCPIDPITFESRLQPRVHAIGDACIAGAMPKSASAAVSQSRQCAIAITALLAEASVPAPMFESVCFSRFAPDRATAMRGRFHVQDGGIQALPVGNDRIVNESSAADRWFEQMRADAFADPQSRRRAPT